MNEVVALVVTELHYPGVEAAIVADAHLILWTLTGLNLLRTRQNRMMEEKMKENQRSTPSGRSLGYHGETRQTINSMEDLYSFFRKNP